MRDYGTSDLSREVYTNIPVTAPMVRSFRDSIENKSCIPRISGTNYDKVETIIRVSRLMIEHLQYS